MARIAFGLGLSSLIVGAVILIGAVSAIPQRARRTRIDRTKQMVQIISRSIARLRSDTGTTAPECLLTLSHLREATSPAACGEFPPCSTTRSGLFCWRGPYVLALDVTADIWGHPFRVSLEADGRIRTESNGPDELPGTADDLTYESEPFPPPHG
jgi:hypothetical protein